MYVLLKTAIDSIRIADQVRNYQKQIFRSTHKSSIKIFVSCLHPNHFNLWSNLHVTTLQRICACYTIMGSWNRSCGLVSSDKPPDSFKRTWYVPCASTRACRIGYRAPQACQGIKEPLSTSSRNVSGLRLLNEKHTPLYRETRIISKGSNNFLNSRTTLIVDSSRIAKPFDPIN